jgi:hypothetical protein
MQSTSEARQRNYATSPSWNATQRYDWATINTGSCNIPDNEDIVVIAHSDPDGSEIMGEKLT